MDNPQYKIPVRANMIIAALQVSGLVMLLFLAGRTQNVWVVALLALGYGVLMNSAYAMLHEAEHNILHPQRSVNDAVGVMLGVFFPAPYHLLRQGHLGHHMRNRSDDEAFDYYFEGENPIWKFLQLYGTLTGFFWLIIALSNIIALLIPSFLHPRYATFDRPTQALLETLNPKYFRLIRLEAGLVVLTHIGLVYGFAIPLTHYCAMFCVFGFMWSALQYAHHYGTERDVLRGARNLKSWTALDWFLLNHNWHLHHHLHPTVPWLYLPRLSDGTHETRSSMVLAYLKMWRGPRFSSERVQNKFAGAIIR